MQDNFIQINIYSHNQIIQPDKRINMQEGKRGSQQGIESNEATDRSGQGQSFIGDFHAAPFYLKDNDKIHTGYRINFNSISKLLKSLFMVHNQSVNIWSHLVPLLVFACLLVSFYWVVDDLEFKKKMSQYRQDFQNTFDQYQASLRNLTLPEKYGGYHQEVDVDLSHIKANIITKYDQIMDKIHSKSEEISTLLDYDIEGLKTSFKQELKLKLAEIQRYKELYEDKIAPKIVLAVENSLDSAFLTAIKTHANALKDHLNSNIFKAMELHPEAPNPQMISRWPIFVFLSTAVLCLLFSTVFHIFHPLSSKTYGLLLRFDFAGISLLIAGSAFPPFYYSMYCHFAVAEIYLTCTVTAAVICFVISLFQFIHRVENIIYRSVVFGTFGLSMSIPLAHLVVNEFIFDNFGDPFRFSSSYPYYIGLVMAYCSGLYIFSVKCPERNNPGKYDICGHSHQIWHFLVVLGILLTYFGVLENYEMRKQSVCPI